MGLLSTKGRQGFCPSRAHPGVTWWGGSELAGIVWGKPVRAEMRDHLLLHLKQKCRDGVTSTVCMWPAAP